MSLELDRRRPSLHPLALPRQGMRFSVFVIHAASPGRFAHHPGVTPGGVICGHRDNSAIGRNLARGPSPACTHVDPHRRRARPRIKAAGVIGPLDLVAIGLLSAGEAEELHAMETSGAAKS
jgi:hypothetical protein